MPCIISANAGSSSLKITVFTTHSGSDDPRSLCNASFSNISSPSASFALSFTPQELAHVNLKQEVPSITDHKSAFRHFLEEFRRVAPKNNGEEPRIDYVCHRVVHGGDYTGPIVINNDVYHRIEELSELAPLHNAAALTVIKICLETLPNSKNYAFFDTTFHRTLPKHIAAYAINADVAEKKGLKKYGFHGLSYAYILSALSQYLRTPYEELNLIVMHLGAGASVCAIKNGVSIDTSMGLTPLDGLPGATRSGHVDPSLIFHYGRPDEMNARNEKAHMHITRAEEILNREAGWKSLTGTTNFGELTKTAFDPDSSKSKSKQEVERSRLAFDMFADRVLNYVGAYYVKICSGQGQPHLVFSGGIGERSAELRKAVCDGVACLGYRIDETRNGNVAEMDSGEFGVIEVGVTAEIETETERGRGRIFVCKTDEQLQMARECSKMTHET